MLGLCATVVNLLLEQLLRWPTAHYE